MFGTPGNNADSAVDKFTTIFFLDYDQNSIDAIDDFVYAYGLASAAPAFRPGSSAKTASLCKCRAT